MKGKGREAIKEGDGKIFLTKRAFQNEMPVLLSLGSCFNKEYAGSTALSFIGWKFLKKK